MRGLDRRVGRLESRYGSSLATQVELTPEPYPNWTLLTAAERERLEALAGQCNGDIEDLPLWDRVDVYHLFVKAYGITAPWHRRIDWIANDTEPMQAYRTLAQYERYGLRNAFEVVPEAPRPGYGPPWNWGRPDGRGEREWDTAHGISTPDQLPSGNATDWHAVNREPHEMGLLLTEHLMASEVESLDWLLGAAIVDLRAERMVIDPARWDAGELTATVALMARGLRVTNGAEPLVRQWLPLVGSRRHHIPNERLSPSGELGRRAATALAVLLAGEVP